MRSIGFDPSKFGLNPHGQSPSPDGPIPLIHPQPAQAPISGACSPPPAMQQAHRHHSGGVFNSCPNGHIGLPHIKAPEQHPAQGGSSAHWQHRFQHHSKHAGSVHSSGNHRRQIRPSFSGSCVPSPPPPPPPVSVPKPPPAALGLAGIGEILPNGFPHPGP